MGYDEHYRPDAYLTRGELCAILSRFSDLKSGASSFQNIEHHWARDYVNICVSNGWIADGTEIDLNSYITVKVAANIIEKCYKCENRSAMQAGFLAVGLHGLPYHTITNSEGKT